MEHCAQAEKKREIMFEVRLSINALKLLMEDLNSGLRVYDTLSLLSKGRDFWQAPELKVSKGEMKHMESTSEELENILWVSTLYIMEKLPKEGQEKVTELFTQFLHEKIEEIRLIAREYNVEIKASDIGKMKVDHDLGSKQ